MRTASWMIKAALSLSLGSLGSLGAFGSAASAQGAELVVSAAVSLKDALEEATAAFAATSSVKVTLNFGASGALAQQIANGAPVDLFVAAGPQPIDLLETQNKLLPGSRRNLVGNSLVLVVPAADKPGKPALKGFQDLGDKAVHRIALGEAKTVPAGQYAEETLRNLGLFDTLKPKFVYAGNVRQVLTYVETGDVDAGFVYLTDARGSPKVRVVATAAPAQHAPIVYPMAVPLAAKHADAAKKLADFLAGGAGMAILARHGFVPPPAAP